MSDWKKATIYLNNLGVSLLRRGCIGQSIDTFNGAITMINCKLRPTPHEDATNQSSSAGMETTTDQLQQQLIQEADQRAFYPVVDEDANTIMPIVKLSSGRPTLSLLHPSLWNASSEGFTEDYSWCMIEMDDSFGDGDGDLRQHTAIILWNYVLALRLKMVMASSQSQQDIYDKLLYRSTHLLLLAFQCLSNDGNDMAHSTNMEEAFVMWTHMEPADCALKLLVLTQLVSNLQRQGRECETFNSALRWQQKEAATWHHVEEQVLGSGPAAGAA